MVKNMDPDKPPGHEGFNAYFFQPCLAGTLLKKISSKPLRSSSRVGLRGKIFVGIFFLLQVDTPKDCFWGILSESEMM